MKKIIGVLAIYATLTVLAAPAFVNVIGQTPQTQSAAPAAAPTKNVTIEKIEVERPDRRDDRRDRR